MNLFEVDTTLTTPKSEPMPPSELDQVLTAQLIVAWAGEGGEEPRLGWWRSDLHSEFGGEDLFRRLLPHTWRWAVLQGAREAARRKDTELRQRDHNPDRILSLYNLGFARDEMLEERLRDLKNAGQAPEEALPGLAQGIEAVWSRSRFNDWLEGHGEVETVTTSVGRRLKGDPPARLSLLANRLVAALAPLADSYPLPHYQRDV